MFCSNRVNGRLDLYTESDGYLQDKCDTSDVSWTLFVYFCLFIFLNGQVKDVVMIIGNRWYQLHYNNLNIRPGSKTFLYFYGNILVMVSLNSNVHCAK